MWLRRRTFRKVQSPLVINNAPTVKAETRQRVLEVIDELGYVPNFNARGLTTKKTNSLGVLITPEKDTTESPFDFQNETEFFHMIFWPVFQMD